MKHAHTHTSKNTYIHFLKYIPHHPVGAGSSEKTNPNYSTVIAPRGNKERGKRRFSYIRTSRFIKYLNLHEKDWVQNEVIQ